MTKRDLLPPKGIEIFLGISASGPRNILTTTAKLDGRVVFKEHIVTTEFESQHFMNHARGAAKKLFDIGACKQGIKPDHTLTNGIQFDAEGKETSCLRAEPSQLLVFVLGFQGFFMDNQGQLDLQQ